MKDPTVVFIDDRMTDRERRLRALAAESCYPDGEPNPSTGKGVK